MPPAVLYYINKGLKMHLKSCLTNSPQAIYTVFSTTTHLTRGGTVMFIFTVVHYIHNQYYCADCALFCFIAQNAMSYSIAITWYSNELFLYFYLTTLITEAFTSISNYIVRFLTKPSSNQFCMWVDNKFLLYLPGQQTAESESHTS